MLMSWLIVAGFAGLFCGFAVLCVAVELNLLHGTLKQLAVKSPDSSGMTDEDPALTSRHLSILENMHVTMERAVGKLETIAAQHRQGRG